MANKATQFKKGKPKTGGRKKNTPNRTTAETRELIQKIVNQNLDSLEDDLLMMNATNRWMVLEKLTKYFLPALSKNDNNNVNSGAMKIVVEYQKAKKEGEDDGTTGN